MSKEISAIEAFALLCVCVCMEVAVVKILVLIIDQLGKSRRPFYLDQVKVQRDSPHVKGNGLYFREIQEYRKCTNGNAEPQEI